MKPNAGKVFNEMNCSRSKATTLEAKDTPLTRFYIDLHDGHGLFEDNEGSDLQNVEQARAQALDLFSDLTRGPFLDRENRKFIATVRDQRGNFLYRATLSFCGEWVSCDETHRMPPWTRQCVVPRLTHWGPVGGPYVQCVAFFSTRWLLMKPSRPRCSGSGEQRNRNPRKGTGELIAGDVRFLRTGDERANWIRDRHCHLVEFR